MANLNSCGLMRYLLLSSFSLSFILLSSSFLQTITAIDNHNYHTVELTSLLPPSVCTPSTIKDPSKRKSTLEVFHRHGPCSQQPQNTPPTLGEILSQDQFRVKSIRARINSKSNPNPFKDQKANLPVRSGRSLGSGNYIVTIGLGSPSKTLSLVFDTGSDLTWTQCQPCARSCYQQQDPIFNPSASTSYSNVSCNSAECNMLSAATGNNPGCSTATCIYGIQYGDKSFSVGFFSKDKLTISASEVFPRFMFGCGQNNQGLFGNTAGLLGLGKNSISIVSQTAAKYGKYFSYCLPSSSASIGYLTLGKNEATSKAKYTPFDRSQGTSFYFIDIVAIAVGGRSLPIRASIFKAAGGIIDSGTVITRLPPAAYSAMSGAFQKLMAKYPTAPAYSILDTCYDLSGYTSVTIPTISFTFSGNVRVDLDATGILVAISRSRVCLAFAGNSDATDTAIFGNTQQKTFEVVYDVAGGKLGFSPGGCK